MTDDNREAFTYEGKRILVTGGAEFFGFAFMRATPGGRMRSSLRRQLFYRPACEHPAFAGKPAVRSRAPRRLLSALCGSRRNFQLRLPRITDPLSVRSGSDDQSQCARRYQYARAREASEMSNPSGLYQRSLRGSGDSSAARRILGTCESDRPARLLRRGKAVRRDAFF